MMNISHRGRIAASTFLVLASLCFALPARAGILIDDYSLPVTPTALVGVFGSSNNRVDAMPSPVPYPFSSRSTTVTAAAAGVISATIGGGQLIDISAFGTGGTVHLAYTAPALGPVNFLAGATNFTFDLLSSANNGLLTVTLVANGAASTGAVPITVSASPTTFSVPIPVNANFAFASFFDVFFELQGGATSLSIDSFRTTIAGVPEPTTSLVWCVVALSGLGLVSLRRAQVSS